VLVLGVVLAGDPAPAPGAGPVPVFPGRVFVKSAPLMAAGTLAVAIRVCVASSSRRNSSCGYWGGIIRTFENK